MVNYGGIFYNYSVASSKREELVVGYHGRDPMQPYPVRRAMKGVLAFLDGVDDVEQMSPTLFALLQARRRVRQEIAELKVRFDGRPLTAEESSKVGRPHRLAFIV